MAKLSNSFLENLVRQLEDERSVGFLLTGSFAREDASSFSDVDLIKFVKTFPKNESERYQLKHFEDHLVSISATTVGRKKREMKSPETAVWTVPGLRQARILSDKTGQLKKLKKLADNFEWKPLQAAADVYAGYNLMGYAEEVHKILGALEKKDESALVYGTMGLVLGLSKIISVSQGILINSENSYFRQLQQEIGTDSKWSFYHRTGCGFDSDAEVSTAKMRALAGLNLYIETAKIIDKIIEPLNREVVRKTVAKIKRSIKNLPGKQQ